MSDDSSLDTQRKAADAHLDKAEITAKEEDGTNQMESELGKEELEKAAAVATEKLDFDEDEEHLEACSPITAHEDSETVATPMWICVGCERPINDKYFLKAMHQFWHEDCLKCSCCNSRLGVIGASLYTRSNLILCKRDYFRLFGSSGQCATCENAIPAYEMVMKVKQFVYHLDCFSCFMCHKRFCIGDRFYLNDRKIICEQDYVRQFYMTSPQFRPPMVPPIDQIRKRSTSSLQNQQQQPRLPYQFVAPLK